MTVSAGLSLLLLRFCGSLRAESLQGELVDREGLLAQPLAAALLLQRGGRGEAPGLRVSAPQLGGGGCLGKGEKHGRTKINA